MADKPKNKGGRPRVHDRETIKAEIINWIICGKSMRSYVQQDGKPLYSTILDWLKEDAEFAAQYTRAREEQADTFADELMAIADEQPPCDADGRTDSAWISWQKNRIEARKWIASKMKPKKYGDRQQIDQTIKVDLDIEQVDQRIARLVEKVSG